jgi:hypothetical protein
VTWRSRSSRAVTWSPSRFSIETRDGEPAADREPTRRDTYKPEDFAPAIDSNHQLPEVVADPLLVAYLDSDFIGIGTREASHLGNQYRFLCFLRYLDRCLGVLANELARRGVAMQREHVDVADRLSSAGTAST